jgi:hypothetical protein
MVLWRHMVPGRREERKEWLGVECEEVRDDALGAPVYSGSCQL